MNDLYQRFIEKIIEQTAEGSLKWETMDKINNSFDAESFDFILFTNEFHQIDTANSYGALNDELNIFLLDEIFESGRDGSINKGLNLYVIKGTNGTSYKVPIDEETLRKLQGQIDRFISSNHSLDNLLEMYLEKH